MEIYDFLLLTTYVPVIGLCARATIIVLLINWLPALGAEHGSRLLLHITTHHHVQPR
jgi:hypothetical protein